MDPYEAYERKRRARNEAFLQRHHKIFTALIFIAALCCFILPWVWLPFWAALWVQIVACMGLYLLGRAYTWAFHKKQEPKDEEEDE